MMKIEEIVKKNILAIIPVYLKDKGNCTNIITSENSLLIKKTINTVLKLLANYFFIDLNASKNYCKKVIGIVNNSPIVFNDENIFVPIKVRKPISRNDGAFGYFNIDCIKIEEYKDDIYINLDNKYKIKANQKFKTVIKHVNDGKILKEVYSERKLKINLSKNYMEFDKPATKADILILRNELLDIKSRLNRI